MITIDGVKYARPTEAPAVLPGRGVTAHMVYDWCRPGGPIGEPVPRELAQPGQALRVGRSILVPVDRLYEVDKATEGVGRPRSTAETGNDTQCHAC